MGEGWMRGGRGVDEGWERGGRGVSSEASICNGDNDIRT